MSDQLKYFPERPPATFIHAGIDVESAGLFAGTRGRQIAGRFTVIPATPFAYGTGAQREQWRALIATMDSALRLHRHRPGGLVALEDYLYRRSGGMIGSLSQLIRGAAILAIADGSIDATIWASQTTLPLESRDRPISQHRECGPARRTRLGQLPKSQP